MWYGNTEGGVTINGDVMEKVVYGLMNEGKSWERKQQHSYRLGGVRLFLKGQNVPGERGGQGCG